MWCWSAWNTASHPYSRKHWERNSVYLQLPTCLQVIMYMFTLSKYQWIFTFFLLQISSLAWIKYSINIIVTLDDENSTLCQILFIGFIKIVRFREMEDYLPELATQAMKNFRSYLPELTMSYYKKEGSFLTASDLAYCKNTLVQRFSISQLT